MSAFTPIASLDQLDYAAYLDEIDRREEVLRNGQNEPPEPQPRYPGFRKLPDEALRQIVADPWPLRPDENAEEVIGEAQAELDRRYPLMPEGYIDTHCVKCKTAIYVKAGTGGGVGLCRKCAGLLVA